MTSDDDDLLFDDEGEDDGPNDAVPWTVLIVDDEPEIHDATRFALGSVVYQGRPIRFLSAYSAAEAVEMIPTLPDLALAFVDVVMETEHAGLDLIRRIRQELGRADTRIILRTGQPGQAPAEKVVVDFDINDYREKTELTAQRLFACTVSALRAYADICALERYRQDAYDTLGHETDLEQQIIDFVPLPLLHVDRMLVVNGMNAAMAAVLGEPAEMLVGAPLDEVLPAGMLAAIDPDAVDWSVIGAVREAAAVWSSLDGSEKSGTIRSTVFALSDGSPGGLLLRIDPG